MARRVKFQETHSHTLDLNTNPCEISIIKKICQTLGSTWTCAHPIDRFKYGNSQNPKSKLYTIFPKPITFHSKSKRTQENIKFSVIEVAGNKRNEGETNQKEREQTEILKH